MIYRSSEASHWYDKIGRPVHSVPNKSKPGQMRPTTLRDAKKLGLVPSVTNVKGSVLANKQLQDWKTTQILMAALTLPRLPGETEDEFAARAIKDAEEQVSKASDFGTRIHNCIEAHLTSGADVSDDETRPFFEKTKRWLDQHVDEVILAESSVTTTGYAGTVDLVCRMGSHMFVIDFKTRKRSKKKDGTPGNIAAYEGDGVQLSAYKKALMDNLIVGHEAKVANLFINSETPEPPVLHEWSREEERTNLAIWEHALAIWRLQRGIKA